MSEMDMNFEMADLLSTNDNLKPIADIIEQVMALDDSMLTPALTESLADSMSTIVTPEMINNTISTIKESFSNQQLSKSQVKEYFNSFKNSFVELVDTLKPSANKKILLNSVFNPLISIFEKVAEEYHSFDFKLPITLEGNAIVPTYAHETDTGADLSALETVVVPARSTGNKIRTGVRIALPENWTAYIVPRSSTGVKTPLRLSNSIGVIDSDYRGELGILYDNISDSDYTINAGDRIAQLIVMPAYHFKAQVVDILPETERSENGFGSTGR